MGKESGCSLGLSRWFLEVICFSNQHRHWAFIFSGLLQRDFILWIKSHSFNLYTESRKKMNNIPLKERLDNGYPSKFFKAISLHSAFFLSSLLFSVLHFSLEYGQVKKRVFYLHLYCLNIFKLNLVNSCISTSWV